MNQPSTDAVAPSPAAALLVDRDPAGVVTLTFNRPQVLNALDWEAMELFERTVETLHEETASGDGPRLLILTGAGERAFCSGGDQAVLHSRLAAADGERLAQLMGQALRRLEQLPIPTVAAVNGFALGGGSEIALACDLRVVDVAVRFGLVHGKLGLIPGWGAGQRLIRLVGAARAMELMLSARQLGAAELEALGLATHLADEGQALPAARHLAAEILELDPAVSRAIKAVISAHRELPYAAALDAEAALFPALWVGEAHVRAVAAFLGRRG